MLLLLSGSLCSIRWSWHEGRWLQSCSASKTITLHSQRNNRCAEPMTRITARDAEALVRSRSLPQKAEDTWFLCVQLQRIHVERCELPFRCFPQPPWVLKGSSD